MHKILLVIEEYAELTSLESALKKVGFNVIGVSSEFIVAQQVLSFNPDFVIASAQGPKLTSIGVGKRLKDMPRWSGHTILAFPRGFKPPAQDLIRIRMDGFIEMPAEASNVIPMLARLAGLDEKMLFDKLKSVSVEEASTLEMKEKERKPTQFTLKKEENHLVSGKAVAKESSFSLEKSFASEKIESEKFKSDPLEAKKIEAEADAKAKSDFATPDMSALEAELKALVGEKTSEPMPPPVTNPSANSKIQKGEAEKSSSYPADPVWAEKLRQVSASTTERILKAKEALKNVNVKSESTLLRQKVKKMQKELAADWNSEELKSQDQLRQQFTRFLFKKKN